MDQALRPMSTSQVLDRTFSLYRSNFVLFAGIAVLPPALLMLVQVLTLIDGNSGGKTTPTLNAAYIGGIIVGALLFVGVYLLGYALALGASIFAVSRTHLGKLVTIGSSYSEIRPYAWRLLGIVIVGFVIVFGLFAAGILAVAMPFAPPWRSSAPAFRVIAGLVGLAVLSVCVFWGVRLSASFALATPTCVLEKRGVLDSLKRSRILAKGSIGRILLVSLLAGILAAAFSTALNIPTYIGAARAGLNHHALPMALRVWQFAASFLASTLAGPIATIAIALIYYDERVRKEAFDLQLMMEAIGLPQQAQGQSAAGASSSIG